MPVYTYLCEEKHETTLVHPMMETPIVYCPVCKRLMHKKPQHLGVNWNGMKPSQGQLHPNIQKLIDTVPERRDRLAEKQEAHERRTAGGS
jgi:hypothetical protein